MKKRIDWLITEMNIVGGAENYVRQIAPLMLHEGWDLKVITLVRGGMLVEELRRENIPVIELGLRDKPDLSIILRLLKIWQYDPPDLLHTHLYHAGIIGRVLAHLMHIHPVVVHQHGPEHNRTHWRTQLDQFLSRWTTLYITTCNAVAQILMERESIPAPKIEVIYNGVTFSNPVTIPGKKPIEWPVPPEHIGLACVGRLSPEKGQSWLLEALAQLKSSAYPIYTVFIGDGDMRKTLIEQSIQLGLERQVSFMGNRRDVSQWLPHFDLFVLPSDWEGISLALLEAMVAKLPVISTIAGGTPEVIIDGETGILVHPKDPCELKEAIQELILNPKKRARMGQAGHKRILENFSLAQSARRLTRTYERLLSQ